MTRVILLSAGVGALAISAVAVGAPAKKAAAGAPPVATYWMDVATQSGLGAGMLGGGQPDMASIMAMMSGNAPSYSHSLRLRLASRTPAPAAPAADHLIPPGLRMGASLPLVTPVRQRAEAGVADFKPKGRILVYWGCGERAGAGQPMILNLADLASGKAPESIKRWGMTMGRGRHSYSGPNDAPGFGEWPNSRDSRTIAAGASLLGPHRVQGNYSPPIDFTLGQDFMGPMTMSEGGMTPAGAAIVRWNPVARATGYALAMFGATEGGDSIMWSSSAKPGFASLDYLSPGDAARAVSAGEALAPGVTQCALPVEVARAVPAGMIMGIAYGPEVHFADAPKNPKWAVTVRFKSNGTLMRGMGDMMGETERPQPPQQEPRKKKKGFGLGDVLNSVVNR